MAATPERMQISPEEIRAMYSGAERSPHFSLDVFTLSAVGMGIIDPSGFWLRANPAMSDFFGYEQEAFLAVHPQDLLHPDDLPRVLAIYEQLSGQQFEQTHVDARCLHRSGDTVWVRQHLTALRIPGRDAMYLLVQIEDITELKRAETSRRRRGEIYRALVRNFPGAIGAVFDRELRYIVVDGNGLADLDLTPDMAEGKTVWEFWGPERGAQVAERLQAALDGEPQRYEAVIGEREYEVRAVPVVEADGAINYGVVVNFDITERKLHEQEIEIASEALARSNRELEEFAVVASHDLRAPLVSLQGMATILADDYRDKLDVEGRYILERIIANADQMQNLLNDLLTISRVGRGDFDFTQIDLADVVAHVMDQQRFSLQRRKGEMHAELAGTLVEANWTRMVQLFTNLIDNAIKYTPPERNPNIEISVEPDGNVWVISVADHGVGVPEDRREYVFGMFNRLRNGKELNPGGSGMGLALVERIVKLHGGDIWIDPHYTAGTRFCFTLPRRDASTGEARGE